MDIINDKACIVCYRIFTDTNLNTFNMDCRCKICFDCIYTWIILINIESLLSLDFKSYCPNDKCNKTITIDWLIKNMNNDRIYLINNIIFKKYLNTTEDIIKCPNKLCMYSGFFETNIKCGNKLVCNLCNNKWLDISKLPISIKVKYKMNKLINSFLLFLKSEYEVTRKIYCKYLIEVFKFFPFRKLECIGCKQILSYSGDITTCFTCNNGFCSYCFQCPGQLDNRSLGYGYHHYSIFGCQFLKKYIRIFLWTITSIIFLLKVFFNIFNILYKHKTKLLFISNFLAFCICYAGLMYSSLNYFIFRSSLIRQKRRLEFFIRSVIIFLLFNCVHINLFYNERTIHEITIIFFILLEAVVVYIIDFCIAWMLSFYVLLKYFEDTTIINIICYVIMFISSFIFSAIYFKFRNLISIRELNLANVYVFSGFIELNRYIGDTLFNFLSIVLNVILNIRHTKYFLLFVNIMLLINVVFNFESKNYKFKISLLFLFALDYCNLGLLSYYYS